ncbi:Response regulator, OmpR-family [Cupriavidus necator]|uniref:Phosphate regulon transcriptional regulatory protein PhoB n=1 Tax=Cupriavidus necator (strain ATCC 17699 / DSM 428 / KCTC 22496 / NCIMB 10442 / H16 / Stanier 337) TaxID=381666 RepID=Q0KAP9_CUPNH|nr:response regulator transcription factor [Cupriavidus necator]QCC00774.1 response regulator transcription factor [Cupriavidus necator H16]QQB76397.1 response regulator transcription factor [Cupriavidus necator]WKA42664.1 response regulator transcription factor [Cupriavidus necator]CAJ92922.1 response regulator, OmpR-family [Cupriavidus necator H16]
MSRQVLVIEDDADIAELVRLQVSGLSCDVKVINHGRAGLEEALSRPYDLVILDLMLPGADGLEICRRLRAEPRYTPILMLTARSTELDRVLGLEMGADDYLTKPFSVLELTARVKAIFRLVDTLANPPSDGPRTVQVKALHIDIDKREVSVRGTPICLTAKEFQLLLYFASNPGRVFSRAQLLDQVWGYSHSGYEHTVSSHINRLRAKIELDPNEPEYIQTVWGVGYKFCNT